VKKVTLFFAIVTMVSGLAFAEAPYAVTSITLGEKSDPFTSHFSVFKDRAIQFTLRNRVILVIPDDYLDFLIKALVDGNRQATDTDHRRAKSAGMLSASYRYNNREYQMQVGAISGMTINPNVFRTGSVSITINDHILILHGGDFLRNDTGEISVEDLYLRNGEDKSQITLFLEALLESRAVGEEVASDTQSEGWSTEVIRALDAASSDN
jgi:hypothetical protein